MEWQDQTMFIMNQEHILSTYTSQIQQISIEKKMFLVFVWGFLK